MTYVIYPINFYILFRVGLCLFLYISGDMAHYETSDRVIKLDASDVTYSQGVRGRILLGDALSNDV